MEKPNPANGGIEQEVSPNGGRRKWIKIWTENWLEGTVRFNCNHKERAVWVDLLVLAGRSRMPGMICAGKDGNATVGLPALRLAGIVDVPEVELLTMLQKFERQGRIELRYDEERRLIIFIKNWAAYQADYSKQARYRAKKRA